MSFILRFIVGSWNCVLKFFGRMEWHHVFFLQEEKKKKSRHPHINSLNLIEVHCSMMSSSNEELKSICFVTMGTEFYWGTSLPKSCETSSLSIYLRSVCGTCPTVVLHVLYLLRSSTSFHTGSLCCSGDSFHWRSALRYYNSLAS